jgi:CRISPR-associated endonuclease/helicase Cas3
MRKLQRYTVTVHRRDAKRWAEFGEIQEWQPGLYVQVCDVGYSEELGLELGDEAGIRSQVWQV